MQPLQICIGPTIRIGRESWCLPYAGFFIIVSGFKKWSRTNFTHKSTGIAFHRYLTILVHVTQGSLIQCTYVFSSFCSNNWWWLSSIPALSLTPDTLQEHGLPEPRGQRAHPGGHHRGHRETLRLKTSRTLRSGRGCNFHLIL